MRAGRVVGFLVVLVVAAGGVGALGGEPVEQIGMDADTVTLDVTLQPDGNATWEIRYRIRLEDANETEAFEQLRADVEADPDTYLEPVEQRMNRTVRGAENATGREMTLGDVSISTRRRSQPQTEYGIVTYRFEWGNFARVEGDTLRAGDAIDQMILDSSTVLRVSWPDGYALESHTPEATQVGSNEIVWEGQRTFDSGQPRVVLAPGDGAAPTSTPTEGATPAAGGDGLGLVPLVALVVVAIAIIGGAVLYRRGGDGPGAGTDESSGGSVGEGSDGDDAGGAASDAGDEGPPPELLSNEERVLALIEGNGGRMRQKEVTERLDWSAARTSQVVSDLREEGKLDSFRLGRENVLTLPDVEIDVGPDDGSEEADGSE